MSIIDPLGKRQPRANKHFTPTATRNGHFRGPENYDTSRSKDIFNAIGQLEAGTTATHKEPSLCTRLLRSIGLSKKSKNVTPDTRLPAVTAFQGHYLTPASQLQHNSIHRQLPEEHVAAWHEAEEARRRTSSGQSSNSSQRQFRGPVPRQPQLPEIERLSRTLDTAFLSPLEAEIYKIMRIIGRCATFTPFTSSRSEDRRQQIMLVHPSNVEPLRHVQDLAATSSDMEKHAIWHSLRDLLIPHLLNTLKVLLFNPDIHITSSSQSGKGYSPELKGRRRTLSRLKSSDFFSGRLNVSLEQFESADRFFSYDQSSHQIQRQEPKPSIFTAFQQKEFMPAEDDATPEEKVTLRLRGGDDKAGRSLPFERSARTDASHFVKPGPLAPLADEERVPRTLWWLSGGRVSLKKKAPTAGELRTRRKAELENRKDVGFLGTFLGVRRNKKAKARSEAAEVEPAEQRTESEVHDAADGGQRTVSESAINPAEDQQNTHDPIEAHDDGTRQGDKNAEKSVVDENIAAENDAPPLADTETKVEEATSRSEEEESLKKLREKFFAQDVGWTFEPSQTTEESAAGPEMVQAESGASLPDGPVSPAKSAVSSSSHGIELNKAGISDQTEHEKAVEDRETAEQAELATRECAAKESEPLIEL
ncbi:hypothetical protein BST61_g446 [Cercospora zeina]